MNLFKKKAYNVFYMQNKRLFLLCERRKYLLRASSLQPDVFIKYFQNQH